MKLSLAQKAYSLLNQYHFQHPDTTQIILLKLEGNILLDNIYQTLLQLIQRHPPLRSNLETYNNKLNLFIQEDLDLSYPEEIDLSDLPEKEALAEMEWMIIEALEEPLEFNRFQPFYYELYKLAQDQRVLLFLLPNILCDDHSKNIFIQDFNNIYKHLINNKDIKTAELSQQYDNYYNEQEQVQKKYNNDYLIKYWKNILSKPLEPLTLPTDDQLQNNTLYHPISTSHLYLSSELKEHLLQFSNDNKLSLFVIFLTTFKILLHLYANQDDIAVCTLCSGREQKGLDSLIGMFSHPLILRNTIAYNSTFESLAKQISQNTENAFNQQEIPICTLLENDCLNNNLHIIQSWFQILFDFKLEEKNDTDDHKAIAKPLEFRTGTSIHDWELLIKPSNNGNWEIQLTFNTDHFESTTINTVLKNYQQLLENILKNPSGRIVKLLHHSKQQNINSIPNYTDTQHVNTTEETIPNRFLQQVALQPEQLAIHTEQECWTYADLNQKSNQIAHQIISTSKEKDNKIALLFSQEPLMLAALLGVLKSGKAYIPLSTSLPKQRLKAMLADAQATTIITTQTYKSLAKALSPHITIIVVEDIPEDTSTQNPNIKIPPESLAYIIYTSGSTGTPKGVMQNHKNVLHFVDTYIEQLNIHKHDKLTQLAYYNFDAAVMDMYGALLSGATLYPFDLKKENLHNVAKRIKNEKITIFHSTPTVFRYFTEVLTAKENFPDIKFVVLGGEMLTKQDINCFKKYFNHQSTLINLYGSTESSLNLLHTINHPIDLSSHTVPIGKPVKETDLILFNKNNQETPLYGEIAIRSPYLFLGYLGQEDLTHETLKYDKETNMYIYKTGDIGRLMPNGDIQCCGRQDHQVKIRGHRVELGEIEAILMEHTSIQQCAVLLDRDEQKEELLAFYTVNQNTTQLSPDKLKEQLTNTLPDYMIPSQFIVIETFPLTPTGKINRRLLHHYRPSSEYNMEALDHATP